MFWVPGQKSTRPPAESRLLLRFQRIECAAATMEIGVCLGDQGATGIRAMLCRKFGGECAEALCEEEDANYGDTGLGILMVRVWRLVLGGARGKGGGEFVVTC